MRKSALLLALWLAATSAAAAGLDDIIDSPMYQAPKLPVPAVVMVLPDNTKELWPNTKELWLKALERPEAEMRYRAAAAIGRAHRRGVKGMETTSTALRAALDRPEQHATVRLALADALIALDVRAAAPSLFQQAQAGDIGLREIVEPALAKWNHRPARAVWLERLRDPATPARSLVLAIQGLAAVRDESAVEPLRSLVLSSRGTGFQSVLPAARALGLLCTAGLEKDAESLAGDTATRGIAARLAAASLLRFHGSKEAIRLLQRLAVDPEPTVAAIAAAGLVDIDPELLVPEVERLLAYTDPKVRSLALDVLFRRPNPKHVGILSDRLDDVHPDVRRKARRLLFELSKKRDFHDQVIAEGMKMLGTRKWRALEQATILLAQVDHKPAAGQLLSLLTFDRPEVFVTAAWGLRKLAVQETLPGVVRHADAQRRRLLGMGLGIPADMIDHQLAQLNQLLGQQKYAPADVVLRRFIPQPGMGQPQMPESRAAAIWALGLLHETLDAKLAADLEVRLTPTRALGKASRLPEDTRVRAMSAISLGRMKARAALPIMRKLNPDQTATADVVANACGWAIEQMTGEVMKPPRPIRMWDRWFLVPNE